MADAEKYLSLHEVSGQSVDKTLKAVARFRDKEGLAFIELVSAPEEGRLHVRSFVSKDEYLRYSVELAAIWVAAGSEASGELTFAGMLTESFCYRLTVGASGATLVQLPNNDRKKSPEYADILARVEARIAALGL